LSTTDIQDTATERFSGIVRVYGAAAAEALTRMQVCVVGLGGVGSWAAEALARTGVGRVTLIDNDTVDASNVNRQIHALTQTLGQSKVAVMAERVTGINPACECTAIDDYLTLRTLDAYIDPAFDYVIDAIDSIQFKAALIHHCRRLKIPMVTTGGAGGLTDPSAIKIADLSRTYNDPLAAKVRAKLRRDHGFPKNPKRSFRVDCVFSSQQPVYPRSDGSVAHQKPGIHGVSLDCSYGYGAASVVTASFGLFAAARAIDKYLRRALKA
jgi:tRNA A37 threonylcarbamoyladenosine dehydratase